jgi:hypothetical protein
MAVINNVVFFYTKIQQPSKKYQSEDTEFSVDCAVSKAEAKAWNKQYPKQKAKEYDNDEFIEKFKVSAVPFPEQDEQFIIKLKKAAVRGGVATPEKYCPKVLVPSAMGNIDITKTKLVSNGSKGKVSYVENTNDFGTFAQLSAILVEELIEYTPAGGGAGSEFGPIVDGGGSKQAEEDFDSLPPAAASKPAKPKAAPKAPAEDEDFSDAPF